MNYQPIENYGVIGDLTTTALVSMEGSIDFMCFPHFDSPTIFAALLDSKKGGSFKIFPVTGEFKNRQRYFPDTNILLRVFWAKTASRKFPISWRWNIWATTIILSGASKSFAVKLDSEWFLRRNLIMAARATKLKKGIRKKSFSFLAKKVFRCCACAAVFQ